MGDRSKLDELRSSLQESGAALLGADYWPAQDTYPLWIGSSRKSLNPNLLADALAEDFAVVAAPLPKDPWKPNIYGFLARAAETFPVGRIEEAWSERFGAEIAIVGAAPIDMSVEEVERLLAVAELREELFGTPADEMPIAFGPDTPLNPGEWVWMHVSLGGDAHLAPDTVKQDLEAAGYRVNNPLEGFFGLFERTFYRDEYLGPNYINVLFHPAGNEGVTARRLNDEIFSRYGEHNGFQNAYATLGTTMELEANQDAAEDFRDWQHVSSGASGVFEATGETLGDVMKIIQGLVKAIPWGIYIGLGVGAAWLGWETWKYIAKERKTARRRGP